MKNGSIVKNFAFFLAGAALGAGVALLLAPQSGRRTRRQIRRKAEDAQDYLEDLGEELAEKGRQIYERGREAAESAARALEQKVTSVTG